MDDVLRAACLTLVRRPGSTLAEVVSVLTRPEFRRAILTTYGEPEGLDGSGKATTPLTAGQRNQLAGPVLSRLRSVLSRRFARDLLGTARSTIKPHRHPQRRHPHARIPKGEIGEPRRPTRRVAAAVRAVVGGHSPKRYRTGATARRHDRGRRVPQFLHLPIGVDDALAEARGYRVSLVLAHQHLAQLPPDVRDAVDANARNKIFFTVSPNDATKLVRHVAPYFDDRDLARRHAFEVVARTVHHGHDIPPFTWPPNRCRPPSPAAPSKLRATARRRSGLTAEQRARATRRRHVGTAPRACPPWRRSHAHRQPERGQQGRGGAWPVTGPLSGSVTGQSADHL